MSQASVGHGVALVTGASSGLGRAVALGLAADGWTVAAAARSQAPLQALADEAAEFTGRILAYPLDITRHGDVLQVIADIEERLGPIDLAVLNAGTHREVSAIAPKSGDFCDLIGLNQMGTVHCIEALVPAMVARGRGRIAIVASLAGYFGLPTAAAYAMTKAGLIAMAEALRPELAGHGVTVQIVNPGFVRTPLTDRNSFPMPFLMDVEPAARRLIDGLKGSSFEITFPRRFSLLLRLLRLLPYRVAFAITRRLVPRA